MIKRLSRDLLVLWLASGLGWHVLAKDTPATENGATTADSISLRPVSPGPADGPIVCLTAKMLENLNYIKQPFNDSVSSRFLDRYIESLDPQHLHFIQSDLSEFEKYRTKLDDLTVVRRRVADTAPAFEIYNRFVFRLQQRVAYAGQLLKTEKFTFDAPDRITINREDSPYPKDLDEAHSLWRERLRFEYLQETLGKVANKKKAEKTASKSAVTNDTEEAVAKTTAKPKSESEEIVDTLAHRYQRNMRTFKDFDNDDVIQIYLSALARVYDPHSDYLGHAQLEQFSIGMNLSLFGIGAELRSEDGYCTINRLLPGGPAIKSGKIKEKDRIIEVAQSNQPPVDVVDMNLSKAVQLIRGPKGTEVRLTIIPAGADASSKKVLILTRDEIPLEDQAAKAKIIDIPNATGGSLRLGIIDLPSFYAPFDPSNNRSKSDVKSTTSADVTKLLNKLKAENVAGVVLDLRRNGGGSLEEAIRLTGLFIKQGPVVQVRDSDGTVQVDSDEDPAVVYDGPLVVLTSRFSASASEILAGALQDYGRALVLGDTSTHGKGSVQSVNTLKPWMQMFGPNLTNDPGALKVTIKKFYRASGASTQLKGVTPDIVLPSVLSESKDFGESALKNPMPWDTIAGANFDHLNRVAPYLADLRQRSSDRITSDQEYKYIQEDIALFKKQQADKSLSLNLNDRLKEKDEADARQKARDKERLARPESQDKVYEITLKIADKPGLPPAVEKTNTVAKASQDAAAAHAGIGSAADLSDEADEEKPPAMDPPLLEAEHILADYIAELSKHNVAWAGGTTTQRN